MDDNRVLSDWPASLDRTFGCWLWTAYKDKRDGRALIWRGRSPIAAYREVYQAEIGPIAVDHVLDHMCRRPSCVAPHHLEAITQSENERRKFWRVRAKRERCSRNHDMRVNSIITPEGGRVCRECNRSQEQ